MKFWDALAPQSERQVLSAKAKAPVSVCETCLWFSRFPDGNNEHGHPGRCTLYRPEHRSEPYSERPPCADL